MLRSAGVDRNRIELEQLERVEEVDDRSSEVFDRLAFAERAVSLVRPRGLRVAICDGSKRVHVERGREWGAGEDARWAILRVPPDASRRAIVSAVLEATGGGDPQRAWALDVLMAELGGDVHPMRLAGVR